MSLSPEKGLLEDPTEPEVRRRASRGVVFLLARYVLLQIVGLAANIALSRILDPPAYGVYAVTLVMLVVFTLVSDFGLGAALLQRRDAIDDDDVATVFAAQQVVLAILLLVGLLSARWLATQYRMGESGVWYFRVMAFAGIISSLKTVPTIIMERRLLYGRLTAIEIAETLVFQATAITLAALGAGTWSFVIAVISMKLVGCATTFTLCGWRPRFALKRKALLELASFAVPFQLVSVANLLRDYAVPILGGVLLDTVSVGFLNWALALAAVPAQMAQIVGRVAFPAYSRVQADRRALASAIDFSVRSLFLLAVPAEFGLLAIAPWLIQFVFTPKWTPALVPLYVLGLGWAEASLTSPLFAALTATGRVRTAMLVGISWTAGSAILAVALVGVIGYVGFAVAMTATRTMATVALVILVRRAAPMKLVNQVTAPLLVGGAVAFGGVAAVRLLPGSAIAAVLLGAAMTVAYVSILFVVDGARVRADLRSLGNLFRSRTLL